MKVLCVLDPLSHKSLHHLPLFGKNKGFSLVEIIVVLLIIAILAAIAIPACQGHLEESRESCDLINVRAVCTDIIAMGKTGYKTDIVREVELTQKKDDWQAFDFVTIAGITHKKSDDDSDNWKGILKPVVFVKSHTTKKRILLFLIGKEVKQKNPLLIFHQVYIVH